MRIHTISPHILIWYFHRFSFLKLSLNISLLKVSYSYHCIPFRIVSKIYYEVNRVHLVSVINTLTQKVLLINFPLAGVQKYSKIDQIFWRKYATRLKTERHTLWETEKGKVATANHDVKKRLNAHEKHRAIRNYSIALTIVFIVHIFVRLCFTFAFANLQSHCILLGISFIISRNVRFVIALYIQCEMHF